MVKKKSQKTKFEKVVSEQYPITPKRGGGILKIDAWENQKGEIVKYSMAYINRLIFSGDNGRVLGYDNTHDYHHKHYFGEIDSKHKKEFISILTKPIHLPELVEIVSTHFHIYDLPKDILGNYESDIESTDKKVVTKVIELLEGKHYE